MIIPGIVAAAGKSATALTSRLTYTGNSLDVSSELSFPNSLSINTLSSTYLYVFSSTSSAQITGAGSSLASGTLDTDNWSHTAYFASTLRGVCIGRRSGLTVSNFSMIGCNNSALFESLDRSNDLGDVSPGVVTHTEISASSTLLSLDSDSSNTKLLGLGANGIIYEYSLSDAWDTDSTVTLEDSLDVSSVTPNPQAICCNSAGTRLWLADINGDVYEYTLSTNRDLSTATLDSGVLSQLSELGGDITDIVHRYSGDALYVLTEGSDATIYEYSWSL